VNILDENDPAAVRAVDELSVTVGYDMRAVDELSVTVGYDVRAVLTPGARRVVRLGGPESPVEVLLNAEEMRALARFAPRPDAGNLVERLIVDARRQGGAASS
jgi:hypothetical protein